MMKQTGHTEHRTEDSECQVLEGLSRRQVVQLRPLDHVPERQMVTHASNRISKLEGNFVVSQFRFFISQVES